VKLSVIQQLALEALTDGRHRTANEIRREAHMRYRLHPNTMNSLVRLGMVDQHTELDPTTFTITHTGLSALEALSTPKGRSNE
jgi:predicted transcriptional regulator